MSSSSLLSSLGSDTTQISISQSDFTAAVEAMARESTTPTQPIKYSKAKKFLKRPEEKELPWYPWHYKLLDRHYTYLVQGHQWKRLENIMDAKVVQMGFERNEKQAKTADAIRMRCMRGGILIGLGEIQRMARKPDPVPNSLSRDEREVFAIEYGEDIERAVEMNNLGPVCGNLSKLLYQYGQDHPELVIYQRSPDQLQGILSRAVRSGDPKGWWLGTRNFDYWKSQHKKASIYIPKLEGAGLYPDDSASCS